LLADASVATFGLRAMLLALAGAMCMPVSPPARADAAEHEAVAKTNAFRTAEGRAAVAVDAALEAAAREFARYMAKTGKYGHRADGRTPAERAKAHGYQYCVVLENIATVYRSSGYDAPSLADALVEGWKKSPEHRRNMLDPDVTQTGIGVAQAAPGRYYAVQMFGRPKRLAIDFSVRNETERWMDYRTAGRSYSLAPLNERMHVACRPPGLTIALPDRARPFSTRPPDGARYVIEGSASGGYAIVAH
jgi:uncharacterized protein YkwD